MTETPACPLCVCLWLSWSMEMTVSLANAMDTKQAITTWRGERKKETHIWIIPRTDSTDTHPNKQKGNNSYSLHHSRLDFSVLLAWVESKATCVSSGQLTRLLYWPALRRPPSAFTLVAFTFHQVRTEWKVSNANIIHRHFCKCTILAARDYTWTSLLLRLITSHLCKQLIILKKYPVKVPDCGELMVIETLFTYPTVFLICPQ